MARVNTCPKCRALLDPGLKTCPYCQTDLRHTRAPSEASDAVATARLGTWILIANVALFFLTVQLDPARGDARESGLRPSHVALVGFGASNAVQIRECHQYWRLLTANFLHLDLLHLIFNSIAILFLFPPSSQTFGSSRTLCIFFLAGIFGFWVSQWRGQNAVGASAALCGLIGALAVYGHRRRLEELKRRMLMWAGLILLFGFISGTSVSLPNIDNWGHCGGLVAGALLGWPASGVRARGGREDRAWRAGARASLAACLLVAAVWQVPNIVRMMGRREVQVYWAEVKRTLQLIHEVAAEATPAAELPGDFSAGPADSGPVTEAVRRALEAARTDPGSKQAQTAWLEAIAAWRRWEGGLACSYGMRYKSPIR